MEGRRLSPMIVESLDLAAGPEFGYAEHLLIWAWRRMAAGQSRRPLIDREFRDAFGEDADEVLATFAVFLDALAYASRRKLAVGFPGCSGLTADEWRVLALMAAAQNDRPALFDAHLIWLARCEARQIMTIGVGALASAFSAHGLCLTCPPATRPAPCARLIAVAGPGARTDTLLRP